MRPLGVELAAMLADRGVDTIFGIPGVHNIELYRGIEEAGIRHVLARHEQGVGFMADGYARATGKPGVCFVISGPGLTNIMTPMGQAYSDSVPMLVISTVLDETVARKGQLHQMRDQEGAAATVCDWSATAQNAEAAYRLVDQALTEFAIHRPRPKQISLPIRVAGGPAKPFPRNKAATVIRANVDTTDIVPILANATRPLFIFGGALAKNPESAAIIGRILDTIPAASFTTYAGRGLVAPDRPLHFGAHLAKPQSADILATSDVVIAIGTELAQVDHWRDALGDTGVRIRVDIDPAVLASDTRASFRINADGGDFLASLERALTTQAIATKELWDMPTPGHWHHPNGFGTLGYALPAAIGGALGHHGPTLAIAGDYGFQYTMQELGTAAELDLSLPILIWDNEALGEIRDNMVAAQIVPKAVHAVNPNWQHLAAAYGCAYAAPKTTADLCQATTDAFSAGRPTLIIATPAISSSS